MKVKIKPIIAIAVVLIVGTLIIYSNRSLIEIMPPIRGTFVCRERFGDYMSFDSDDGIFYYFDCVSASNDPDVYDTAYYDEGTYEKISEVEYSITSRNLNHQMITYNVGKRSFEIDIDGKTYLFELANVDPRLHADVPWPFAYMDEE